MQDALSSKILHLHKAATHVLVCWVPFSENTLIQTYKKCKALERETKASFRVSPQANNPEYDGTMVNKSKAV